MNPIRLFVLPSIFLVGAAFATTSTENIESKTIFAWTATDGTTTVDSKSGTITLPTGAQLSRRFAADQVEVHLVTRPVFSATPASWASLEIGPVSLSFVRDEKGGGMVLLADEPLALPFALPLDAEGRSVTALDFSLTYDGRLQTATLAIGEANFDVEATTSSSATIEVALAAGSAKPWLLEKVEVRLTSAATAPFGAKTANANGPAAAEPTARPVPAGEFAQVRKQAQGEAWNLFSQNSDVLAEKTLADTNRNPKFTSQWYLETATELTHTALSFARAGKTQKAVQVAQRALENTEKASRKAARQSGQAAIAAAAEELAAFIHERLLADYGQAQVMYQRASGRRASGYAATALERLSTMKAEAGRKSGAKH